jgi:hypothetical protein
VADPILFDKFREYYIALPPGYNNSVPLPLVLSFHGFYDEAIDMQKTDKLMYMARTESPFIVVHPQGLMDTGTHQPQKPYPQVPRAGIRWFWRYWHQFSGRVVPNTPNAPWCVSQRRDAEPRPNCTLPTAHLELRRQRGLARPARADLRRGQPVRGLGHVPVLPHLSGEHCPE